MTVGNPPRTKAEQREATRAHILDAAVACLVELGYGKTTTLAVQERAGVSRGALLHHFPTRAELLAETLIHFFALQGEERRALRVRPGGRIEQAVRLLWAMSTLPMPVAVQELWAAARTDPELRVALFRHHAVVEQEVMSTCVQLFGPELAEHPNFEATARLLVTSMRGCAQTRALQPGSSAQEDLAMWVEAATRMLA